MQSLDVKLNLRLCLLLPILTEDRQKIKTVCYLVIHLLMNELVEFTITCKNTNQDYKPSS